MSKTQTKKPESQNKKDVPKLETIQEWVKKDMQSALYLLSFVTQRHPEIIEEMAAQIHAHAMTTEQGQAIDKIIDANKPMQ